MKAIIRAPFILFLFIFAAHIQATEYPFLNRYVRKLESIDYKDDKVFMCLSDGIVCESVPQMCEREILNLWKQGDLVEIDSHPRKNGLMLANEDLDILYALQITLTNESVHQIPTIQKIIKIRNQEYQYAEVFDLYVYLSDGSCWKYSHLGEYADNTFSKWKNGDHVIVTSASADTDFALLINYNLAYTEDSSYADQFLQFIGKE